MSISHLRPGLAGDAASCLVCPYEFAQCGSPGPPPRADVAGHRLDLLDVHVRVQREVGKLVGGVPSGVAVRSPMPGKPTWCSVRPCTLRGRVRSVTSTRASMALRAVTIVAQPRCSRPRSAASCGETSQKNAGCSSDRYDRNRDMPPAV